MMFPDLLCKLKVWKYDTWNFEIALKPMLGFFLWGTGVAKLWKSVEIFTVDFNKKKIYNIYSKYSPSDVFYTVSCTCFVSRNTQVKRVIFLLSDLFSAPAFLQEVIKFLSAMLLFSEWWNNVFGNSLSHGLSKISLHRQFVKSLDLPIYFYVYMKHLLACQCETG